MHYRTERDLILYFTRDSSFKNINFSSFSATPDTELFFFLVVRTFGVYLLLFSSAPDGVYYLKLNENSEMYPVYCHMSSLSAKCGGGGWTLVMKLDRDKVKLVWLSTLVLLNE